MDNSFSGRTEFPRNMRKSSVVMVKFDSARKAKEFTSVLNKLKKDSLAVVYDENEELVGDFVKNWWEIEVVQ